MHTHELLDVTHSYEILSHAEEEIVKESFQEEESSLGEESLEVILELGGYVRVQEPYQTLFFDFFSEMVMT
jgi:hypothetical protein